MNKRKWLYRPTAKAMVKGRRHCIHYVNGVHHGHAVHHGYGLHHGHGIHHGMGVIHGYGVDPGAGYALEASSQDRLQEP